MTGLLVDRAVVVTGAGRGLGRAFAIAIAEAGGAVVVNDIDADEAQAVVDEIVAAGGRALASGHSVAEWDSAGALIGSCVEAFGSIDGLVNNAVAYPYFGPAWDEDGDQIRLAVEVNVLGALFCGVHAMRHMREQRRGSIVNLTSRAMQGIPGAATYGVTKGALASATYGWAIQLEPFGVRVNALSPGAKTRAHDLAASVGTYAAPDAVPPERIAPAVVYLLSDLAKDITGQVLALVGGKLGVFRHPVMETIEERPAWTPEDIADRFGALQLESAGLDVALARPEEEPRER